MILRGKQQWLRSIHLLILLFCLSSAVFGQNLIKTGHGKKHRGLVGFKGGVLTQTYFTSVATSDSGVTAKYQTRVGMSWQLFFDLPVSSKLFSSLSFELQDVHVLDQRHQMLDVGLSLKYPIYMQLREVAWRPLIGIGYGYLGEGESLEQSSFTTWRVGLEGVFYTQRRHAFLGEFLIYGSISGGNDNNDISFGPVVLLRLGVIF